MLLSRLVFRTYRNRGTLTALSKNVPPSVAVPMAWTETGGPTMTKMTSAPSSSVRMFHASPIWQAVRRRRRGGTPPPSGKDDDDDDSSAATATPRQKIRRVTQPAAFEEQATLLLDTIFQALQPLQAINDPFILTRARDPDVDDAEYILLELGPLYGQYTIQIVPEDCLVHYQSPISGAIQYFKSLEDGEWRSIDDGHIFQGLLVRDLLRQIQGVPKL